MNIARIARRLGSISVWLVGLALLFACVNINEPYLMALRTLLLASVVICILLIRRGCWSRRRFAGRVLIALWCLPALSVLGADVAFEVRKRDVLQTDAARARVLGQHFVVGYSSFDEVAPLAEKGLIAGVYVARHNIAGRSLEALKLEIAALQDRRRAAGLPPLMVAADQEGGIVSHLSPPLTALPPLSTLSNLPPDVRAEQAEEFGRAHGRELAALGVNHDFAPVLDLRPKASRNRFDFNTLINQRAISGDPAAVTAIGLAYVRGLDAFNVGATLKHFPGLGRVRADTISVPIWTLRCRSLKHPTGFPSGKSSQVRMRN